MILDLLGIECNKIHDWILRVLKYDVASERIQSIIDYIILLIIVYFICRYAKSTWVKICDFVTGAKKWRKDYISSHLNLIFEDYKNDRLSKRYISTRVQNDAPSIYEEPILANAASVSNNFINHFINSVFINNNQNRLYCILADTGMGKTTSLVNLFISYINTYTEKSLPFNIELLSLTSDTLFEDINNIKCHNKTILLLDALDENIDAVVDHKSFLQSLEHRCSNFRFVVISCRTQFFSNEDEQMKESKIKIDGNNKGYAAYTTLYISPFNDREILQYIDCVYGNDFYLLFQKENRKRKKRAISIIKNENCRNILVRPMILSYIKELASNEREYRASVDIYEAMVDRWVNRENGRVEFDRRPEHKDQIMNLSSALAVNIYTNRIERKGYYIGREDLDVFLNNRGIDNKLLHFKERSLLNRDAEGLVKFSHKSFLEYFLAKSYFEDSSLIDNFSGIDFTQKLYYELCEKYFAENSQSSKNDISIKHGSSAISGIIYFDPEARILRTGEKLNFSTIVRMNKVSDFNLRYLEYLSIDKLHISKNISSSVFSMKFDWFTKITAIEIDVSNHINMAILRNFPNVRFLFINGGFSIAHKQIIKDVIKITPNATIVHNGKCILHSGEEITHNDIETLITDDIMSRINKSTDIVLKSCNNNK